MKSERERARRFLEVVRGLPAGVLDIVAADAPGSSATWIAMVREALAAPDPEAALADAMRGITGVPAEAIANSGAALKDITRLTGAIGSVRTTFEASLGDRKKLAAGGVALRELVANVDPDLTQFVDRALATLTDEAPFVAVRAAFAAIANLESSLTVLARGEVGTVDLATTVAQMNHQRDAISAAREQLTQIPARLAEAQAYAEARGDRPALAHLAAIDAMVRDSEPDAVTRWQAVLELAVAAKLLPLARHAGNRIAQSVIESGSLESVAQAAARVAELALQANDIDVALEAMGNQAIALAQLEGSADRARELLTQAHRLGEGDPVRGIRVWLMDGLVRERLGDVAAARRAFRKVMSGARTVDGVGHQLGWAALHLGQLEAAAGQSFRAGQDLELAQKIGRAAGDLRLFVLAAFARIEHAPDRTAAEAVLNQAADLPAEMRDALREAFETRWDSAHDVVG